MAVRELFGMNYKSIEYSHSVDKRMPEVLQDIAEWMGANGIEDGILVDVSTSIDIDNEDQFNTTVVWAI